jgi:hypothetical protein
MQIRKASGAFHADTIRSIRDDNGKRVSAARKKLTDLTPADLDKLCAPEANKALYAAIRQRLAEHGGDAKKAFAGGIPKPLGIAPRQRGGADSEDPQRAGRDMLLTSAGVSRGDYDVVKDVLAREGEIDFWTVRMRPGKPLAFGTFPSGGRRVPHIGFPGNPVSSMISFELFARPLHPYSRALLEAVPRLGRASDGGVKVPRSARSRSSSAPSRSANSTTTRSSSSLRTTAR